MTFIRALKKRYKKRKNRKILELIKQANIPPVVDFYEYKRQGIEFNKDKIERLVLGSSHGQAAVDTKVVPNTFNLSIASQDMYQSFKLCEKYIPTLPHLKTVILFFSVFSSGAEMQKTVNAPLCQYYKNIFDIDFKYPLEGPYYKEVIDFMKSNLPPLNKDYMGYSPIEGVFNEEVSLINVKGHIKHAKRNTHQEEYVRQIHKLCTQYGLNLLVIIPPHSPDYHVKCKELCLQYNVDYTKLFTPLFDITNKENIKVLDYFNAKEFKNDDFWDWEHLNPKGAVKFSKLLLKELERNSL